MKSKIISFAVGFILAAVVTSSIALHYQSKLRDRHADCPLEESEATLRSWAALSDSERVSLEEAFRAFASEGLYPQMAKQLGSYRSITALYDEQPDESSLRLHTVEAISLFLDSLDDLASDSDLGYRLKPQIEALRTEVTEYLAAHPELQRLLEEKANKTVETTQAVTRPTRLT